MAETLLITGASGQLGSYLLRTMPTDPAVAAWSGTGRGHRFGHRLVAVDIGRPDVLAEAFRAVRPRWIVHLAAMSGLGECEASPQRAWAINVEATRQLVQLAAQARATLLLASTDLVFDGELALPGKPESTDEPEPGYAPEPGPESDPGREPPRGYREQDVPAPLSVYGRTKLEAERAVLQYERGIVVRLSLLFGPSLCGRPNFFDRQVEALRSQQPFVLFDDEWRTPLSMEAAAAALPAIVRDLPSGTLHLGGPETVSRWEFGCRLARRLGAEPSCLLAASRTEGELGATRPRNVSLDSRQFRRQFPNLPWPPWEEASASLKFP